MVPRAATCVELDMSVDEALKYIISMGVVAPRARRDRKSTPTPHRPLTCGTTCLDAH